MGNKAYTSIYTVHNALFPPPFSAHLVSPPEYSNRVINILAIEGSKVMQMIMDEIQVKYKTISLTSLDSKRIFKRP